ncbi:MAG: hypothetical protein ACJAYX_002414 [Planctomycetota bacterium]|jgi:hypothetical protein
MSQVDLNLIRFDFDLTFAAILMHADGTIYHRYGGRGPDDANSYLSLESLSQLLRNTVAEHRTYNQSPSPPPKRQALLAIDLPVLKRKIAGGQRIDCVHCHTVHDAEHVDAMLGGRLKPDHAFVFPDPERIGLTLDHQQQREISEVAPGSAAAKAGIKAGDELLSLGVQRSVRTLSDVKWALHVAPPAKTQLKARIRRKDQELAFVLKLDQGWKRCPPEQYSWRPYKWNLSPAPGFGGPVLTPADKKALNATARPFMMRVSYMIDWGENKHRGRAARAAGLKKGDIVVGFAGKNDFKSFSHLHAWVSLTLQAGKLVDIEVLRDGAVKTLSYKLPK